MANINLTEQDIQKIIECIETQIELPQALLIKLSPSFFEKLRQEGKFDFKELNKYKIPTLEYAGKRSESVILAQAAITGGAAPLQVVRSFGDAQEGQWRNMIVQGDNLQFLKTCYMNQDPLIKDRVKWKVRLIYIDPPFATKSDFQSSDGAESYADKIDRAEFIESLRERLIYLREILADDGSIYVHLDSKMSHYVKIIMDEIFGKDNFVNEIIWAYRTGGASKKESLPRKHDNVLFYKKNAIFQVNSQRERQYLEKGFMGSKQDKNGRYYVDTLLRDVFEGVIYIVDREEHITEYNVRPVLNLSSERIGYPTQKPEGLISLLLQVASNPGDLVLDVFAGSGTTAAVAEKLGRRWIVCDFGKHAIYTMQKRILNIAESKKLGKEAKKNEKYAKPPKPFIVVSAGAYDFSKIMDLRKNKDAYISFVLGLFGIVRDSNIDYSKKYNLVNIYAEKDGNPVEVFPVWDDDFLQNVRIDEEYLKDIIDASGGKLKGNYYIITPETCTVISDTTLQNTAKEDVNFKLLKFPYKVLEEVSRQFQLEEQPASSDNINRLITSVGFYFNEEVKIEVKKQNEGFKITKFETKILNKNREFFKGLDGLSMILIDKNYNGKVFNMDVAVYAKDISEDGLVKVSNLTENSCLIAVDKHGNESKPVKIG